MYSPDKRTSSFGNDFSTEQLYAILDKVPICINVLNEKAESLYCNSYTLKMYELDSSKTYTEKFYDLTPETQPDGKNSKLGFAEQVLIALEKGENHFNWIDTKLTGEEIPLSISIYNLNLKNENGDTLLVSTMIDLRPHLADDVDSIVFDDYYHNRITYKALFSTVAELAEEWFWVYDVNLSTIQFFGKGREILGLVAQKVPFPSYVVDSGMVYPEDLNTFLHFDSDLKTGVVRPTEVRFVQPDGTTKYYRIVYKTIYNKEGEPLFSIGKTYDIDRQKRLEVLSKTDLLTNCLNKITTENTIKDIIETTPSSHALFLIDVDDFKSVNDQLGHYFGDITLSDIAKNLHSNFRSVDIIGRIGGDEFLVFVKDISNEKVIISKAEAITKAFNNSYSGENGDYKVSGSIGIALYPKHASSYEELYKCADKALYSSKMAGKDRYTIYSDDIANADTKNLTAVDTKTKPTGNYLDSSIASAVFDMIYQSDDVKSTLKSVVRLVGKHMNASRCYIAQTYDTGCNYSISYEWAQNSFDQKKDLFQNIPFDSLVGFFAELEENGIMFNNEISSIKKDNRFKLSNDEADNSYLLVQTKGKDFTRLILGVDDNNRHRVWSEKEKNTIEYIAKMISIFTNSANINKLNED